MTAALTPSDPVSGVESGSLDQSELEPGSMRATRARRGKRPAKDSENL